MNDLQACRESYETCLTSRQTLDVYESASRLRLRRSLRAIP